MNMKPWSLKNFNDDDVYCFTEWLYQTSEAPQVDYKAQFEESDRMSI